LTLSDDEVKQATSFIKNLADSTDVGLEDLDRELLRLQLMSASATAASS
jgi:hypothetical protein